MKKVKTFEKISEKIKKLSIPFEEISFTDKTVSTRQKDTSIKGNYIPEEAVKTIVVKTKKGIKAVILKGTNQIDQLALKAIVDKWSIVSPEVLEKETGFLPGCVCPLDLDVPILIDKSVLEMENWNMGAGNIYKGIAIKKNDALKIIGSFQTVDVTKKSKVEKTKSINNIEEKLSLITRNTEEVLTKEDLKNLITSGTKLKHYIGFEISGKVHLGTGLMSMGKVADFLRAGVKCTLFLADFHSYLNNKLGRSWDNIRRASEGYFKEGLIASLKCFKIDVEKEIRESNLRFVMGADLYKNNLVHWETFMEVGKHLTLSRNLRSISIMGKKMDRDVDMATLFYPPLQVADIFTLGVNIAHAGIDQRKAHVIAREVAKKLTINPLKNKKGEVIAPVAIHHKTIAGLEGPKKTDKQKGDELATDLKMSKSKPDSAIFVHDSPNEIRRKITKAFCPPRETEFNPIINWSECLIFWGQARLDSARQAGLEIKRPAKFGGNKKYQTIKEIKEDYKKGNLHPADLKNAVAEWLITKLEPARKHFNSGKAKNGLDFLEKITTKT